MVWVGWCGWDGGVGGMVVWAEWWCGQDGGGSGAKAGVGDTRGRCNEGRDGEEKRVGNHWGEEKKYKQKRKKTEKKEETERKSEG